MPARPSDEGVIVVAGGRSFRQTHWNFRPKKFGDFYSKGCSFGRFKMRGHRSEDLPYAY